MTDNDYIRIVAEIFDGYSEVSYGDQTVFVKHFTLKDQRKIEFLEERYLKLAVKRGVPLEKDVLRLLEDEGMWTSKDDSEIKIKKDELENLRVTQKQLPLLSQREEIQARIEDLYNDISEIEHKKMELLGVTAERYSQNRSNEEFLRRFIFLDTDLTDFLYTQEEFDDLESEDLVKMQALRFEIHERLEDDNIQKVVLQPFFSLYLSLCEDASGFFGKPVVDLSIPQMKLLAFGRMFENIFQFTENIPDNIRQDPKRLISFAEAQRNKDGGKLLREDADASMVFGATKEDMKEIAGPEQDGGVQLTDVLKEKGGKLNMQDMMKLSGHD